MDLLGTCRASWSEFEIRLRPGGQAHSRSPKGELLRPAVEAKQRIEIDLDGRRKSWTCRRSRSSLRPTLLNFSNVFMHFAIMVFYLELVMLSLFSVYSRGSVLNLDVTVAAIMGTLAESYSLSQCVTILTVTVVNIANNCPRFNYC